jgi:hypothetical protein
MGAISQFLADIYIIFGPALLASQITSNAGFIVKAE